MTRQSPPPIQTQSRKSVRFHANSYLPSESFQAIPKIVRYIDRGKTHPTTQTGKTVVSAGPGRTIRKDWQVDNGLSCVRAFPKSRFCDMMGYYW